MSSLPFSALRMTQNLTIQNGAEWVRVDFHLHTKADKEFKFKDAEDTFIRSYIAALKAAEIRVGVITNHNKFDFGEFKALRKSARKEGITLLPGVELSVGDGHNGVHTLIVFSDEWIADGQDFINQFLNIAFAGKPNQQYENENGRSELNIAQTLDKLEDFGRDFFLVFAHVEDKSGLWKELGGGRIGELGNDERFRRRTLGFQKVRSNNKTHEANKPCREKVKSWLGDWYPAEVEGSDPKSIEQVGKGDNKTFVKLGELSFEALKFALTAFETRVAAVPPRHEGSYIRRVHFEGGIFDGQTLYLSPELNTLIGIRGSGKSSFLEAIRYALDLPHGEKAQDLKYKDELIHHTLGSGGKVVLTAVDIYGQEFTVSRIYREAPNVYLDGTLQPGVSIRETILRRPIYFGQKDLSSTGDGFEKDLVEKLVGESLRGQRKEIEAQRDRVRDAVQRWLKLNSATDRKPEFEAQLSDAKFRLQKFEEHGVADKLKKRVGFEQDAAALVRMEERADSFIRSLAQLITAQEDELRNATGYTSKQNPEFFVAYYEEFSHLISKIDQLKSIESDSRAIRNRLQVQRSGFENARANLQEEFAQIERQLTQELKEAGRAVIQPDEFLTQQQRKTSAEQMLEALAHQENQQSNAYNKLLEELDKLNNLWLREFNTIKKALDHVNANDGPLQIQAEFKGDKDAAIGFMQQLFRGSNIRETTLRSVMADYADFGGLLRGLDEALKSAGSTPEVFKKTFIQNLGEFITWQVPNLFTIRYRGKELQHHSLGQRASALLLYVLSQRQNDVIIIDQPEDDLDNQTIYDDVITQIRALKPSTQFIFATHNANFPVLGDAEQVHACRYEDAKVFVISGSIDAQPVQQEIVDIMEGGQEAFNRRKEVYNLWKSQS